MNKWLNNAQSRLFPPTCIICGGQGGEGVDLCPGCEKDLPWQQDACHRCALPLHGAGAEVCGRCQNDPPSYDRAYSVFHYAHPLDRLIQDLKFHHKLTIARLLGEIMADNLAHRAQPRPELIIPVPLHPARLRQRGYNQALELARPIARRLGVPLDFRSVQRQRATPAQSDLPAADRHRNVKDAFTVAANFRAHHVAIIDDVMTTGSTVEELAVALRKAGVEKIEVWVCARAALG